MVHPLPCLKGLLHKCLQEGMVTYWISRSLNSKSSWIICMDRSTVILKVWKLLILSSRLLLRKPVKMRSSKQPIIKDEVPPCIIIALEVTKIVHPWIKRLSQTPNNPWPPFRSQRACQSSTRTVWTILDGPSKSRDPLREVLALKNRASPLEGRLRCSELTARKAGRDRPVIIMWNFKCKIPRATWAYRMRMVVSLRSQCSKKMFQTLETSNSIN